MKSMTCNQLGGACEQVFSGETFDDLAAQSQQHGKEMYGANDGPHMAAKIHPNAKLITGSICGVKIVEIEDPLMKKIRYMDKLVDELAKGRPMEKILRSGL